jgi:uncharacterized membrane protein
VIGVVHVIGGTPWPGYDFWGPSRVMPFTINEFPFWTFLFADMHPHLIAMPLGMLVVGLALNWVLVRRPRAGIPWTLACLGLLIVALGALGATNTWDLPIYALLVAGAFWLVAWRRRDLLSLAGALALSAAVTALAILAYGPFYTHYHVGIGGNDGPFLAHYLAPVHGSSPVDTWLLVWGIFLFLAYSIAFWQVWTGRADRAGGSMSDSAPGRPTVRTNVRSLVLAGIAALGAAALLMALGRPTAALGAIPAVLVVAVILRRRLPPEDAFANLLLLLGLAIVIGIELFYVRDFLDGGDWYRMNTVFKFSMPAWLFLALAGGTLLPRLWHRDRMALPDQPGVAVAPVDEMLPTLAGSTLLVSPGAGRLVAAEETAPVGGGGGWAPSVEAPDPPPLAGSTAGPIDVATVARPGGFPWLRRTWQALVVLLLAGGACFLLLGAPARVDDRFPGARPAIGTLDGTAYMAVGRYSWPDEQHMIQPAYDYLAIQWLLDHVTGTPVVAEAPAGEYLVNGSSVGYDYYRAGGLRVATMTGFPTLVGQHQYEQRSGAEVSVRTALGQEFFQTTEIERARSLIEDLHIDYVYVGQLERTLFDEASLAKFEEMTKTGELEVVYRNPQVTIYHVK